MKIKRADEVFLVQTFKLLGFTPQEGRDITMNNIKEFDKKNGMVVAPLVKVDREGRKNRAAHVDAALETVLYVQQAENYWKHASGHSIKVTVPSAFQREAALAPQPLTSVSLPTAPVPVTSVVLPQPTSMGPPPQSPPPPQPSIVAMAVQPQAPPPPPIAVVSAQAPPPSQMSRAGRLQMMRRALELPPEQ